MNLRWPGRCCLHGGGGGGGLWVGAHISKRNVCVTCWHLDCPASLERTAEPVPPVYLCPHTHPTWICYIGIYVSLPMSSCVLCYQTDDPGTFVPR